MHSLLPLIFLTSTAELTQEAQKDGQQDEPVSGTEQHNAQVHAEVEYLEDLRLGKGQHDDAGKLGERDAGQDTAARRGHRLYGALASCANGLGVGTHNVRNELYADAHAL